jgi:hypothetical protein
MIYPQIIKLNNLEPIKDLTWPMGNFMLLEKLEKHEIMFKCLEKEIQW